MPDFMTRPSLAFTESMPAFFTFCERESATRYGQRVQAHGTMLQGGSVRVSVPFQPWGPQPEQERLPSWAAFLLGDVSPGKDAFCGEKRESVTTDLGNALFT